MTHTRQLRELDGDDVTTVQETSPKDEGTHEGELRLTVRRLELPVRPRGVLAE